MVEFQKLRELAPSPEPKVPLEKVVNTPEYPHPLDEAFHNDDSPLLSVLRTISALPNRGLQCLRVGARLAGVALPRTAA